MKYLVDANMLNEPIKDSLIAATALVHDLVVATHNRSDFEKAGLKIVDPFEQR